MGLSLEHIESAAWSLLQEAAADPGSGFRYVTLATVDASGQPQARMVVLRRVDVSRRLLEFYTDIRSPKWAELAANPKATVLGYDAATRLQLRLTGQAARLEGVGARKAWDSLPPWTRATYAGGPPGDELAFDTLSAPAATGEGEPPRLYRRAKLSENCPLWNMYKRRRPRSRIHPSFANARCGFCWNTAMSIKAKLRR